MPPTGAAKAIAEVIAVVPEDGEEGVPIAQEGMPAAAGATSTTLPNRQPHQH